jgi:hypothetical protein
VDDTEGWLWIRKDVMNNDTPRTRWLEQMEFENMAVADKLPNAATDAVPHRSATCKPIKNNIHTTPSTH